MKNIKKDVKNIEEEIKALDKSEANCIKFVSTADEQKGEQKESDKDDSDKEEEKNGTSQKDKTKFSNLRNKNKKKTKNFLSTKAENQIGLYLSHTGKNKNQSELNNKKDVPNKVVQIMSKNKNYEKNDKMSEKSFESDDEEEENRIGDVPLEWYEDFDHIGYNVDGKKIIKSIRQSEIDDLLSKADDPNVWRKIKDVKNNKIIQLSATDIEIIRRLRNQQYVDASFSEENFNVEFDNPDKIYSVFSGPPSKNQFIPSKWEGIKITKLVRLIRKGRICPNKSFSEVFDLWGSAIRVSDEILDKKNKIKLPPPLPAPKMSLPNHAESYNPPEEYLYDEKEKNEWEKLNPSDRSTNFLPSKFLSLRNVPSYKNLIEEKFQRCLDLYLCPRAFKYRMNVNPDSILPKLPSPSSLKPFPSHVRMEYNINYFSLNYSCDLNINKMINCLSVDKTGSWLAVAAECGAVYIFDVLTSRPFYSWIFNNNVDVFNNEFEKKGFIEGMENNEKGVSRTVETKGNRVTCLSWHPKLPIIAFAVEEKLYIVVINLPNYDDKVDEISKEVKLAKKMKESTNYIKRGMNYEIQGKKTKREIFSDKEMKNYDGDDEEFVEEKSNNSVEEEINEDGKEDRSEILTSKYLEMIEAKNLLKSKLITDECEIKNEEEIEGSDNNLKKEEQSKSKCKWMHFDVLENDPIVKILKQNGVLTGVCIEHHTTIRHLSWHIKGFYLSAVSPTATSPSHQCAIHNLTKHVSLNPFRKSNAGKIQAAIFHPKKPFFIVACFKGIKLYDLQKRNTKTKGHTGLVKKLIGSSEISCMHVHPNGEHIIVGTENRKLIWFDLELSNKPFKIFCYHQRLLKSVGFHDRFPLMFSASNDGCAHIFYSKVFVDEIKNPLIIPVKKLRGMHQVNDYGGITTAVWHPTNPWIFTAGADGNIFLWV